MSDDLDALLNQMQKSVASVRVAQDESPVAVIPAAEEEEQEEDASPPTRRVEGERLLSFASVVSESDDPFFFLPSTRHLLFLFIGFICFGFV